MGLAQLGLFQSSARDFGGAVQLGLAYTRADERFVGLLQLSLARNEAVTFLGPLQISAMNHAATFMGGLQLGLVNNVRVEDPAAADVRFVGLAQIGLLNEVTRGPLMGIGQFGILSYVGGHLYGFGQLGFINAADSFHGVLQAGFANVVTNGSFDGFGQFGVGNFVDQHFNGFLQTALIFNGATRAFRGVAQISALVNLVTRELAGASIGIVNKTEQTTGLQAGLVNLTGKLRGVQLGLVNISDDGGLPFAPVLNVGL
ncbi:LA_2272 family surface repeat-containing protein [Chondromyces crocatus]|uniref:Uncharacterized protein n=1 Tax=Chondromyces crocatus TaxID=52 RepID=A0A0K1EAH8_CHOCO|nr:hypothetical protein [Chondromyces crocatus]AKT37677.1 uncharacterized protein CMC5_018190 [Chondromyces crocatus]